MISIVVGGQMDKQAIAKLVEQLGQGRVSISVKSDLDGALAIQTGQAQYYVGACNTGAGGALGLAVGLLGPKLCVSISTPGKVMGEAEIRTHVQEGKRAFGMVVGNVERQLPILMDAILNANP